MRGKRDRRSPSKPFRQRSHGSIGHGAANFTLPQIDKNKIWEGLDLQGTQLIHQILRVQMQQLLWKWDRVDSPRFGTCPIGVIGTWNESRASRPRLKGPHGSGPSTGLPSSLSRTSEPGESDPACEYKHQGVVEFVHWSGSLG